MVPFPTPPGENLQSELWLHSRPNPGYSLISGGGFLFMDVVGIGKSENTMHAKSIESVKELRVWKQDCIMKKWDNFATSNSLLLSEGVEPRVKMRSMLRMYAAMLLLWMTILKITWHNIAFWVRVMRAIRYSLCAFWSSLLASYPWRLWSLALLCSRSYFIIRLSVRHLNAHHF